MTANNLPADHGAILEMRFVKLLSFDNDGLVERFLTIDHLTESPTGRPRSGVLLAEQDRLSSAGQSVPRLAEFAPLPDKATRKFAFTKHLVEEASALTHDR